MSAQREFLIARLSAARQILDELVSAAPTKKDIYPGWTLKQYLDHLSGWDDAVVEALQAHARSEPIPQTAARGINVYNAQTVSTRETLDLEHTRREYDASRRAVLQALQELPDEKFNLPLTFPWGEQGTVAYMIEIFVDHDEHHAQHLRQWMANPDEVIVGH
jgi:uncharacterized damage-inducible protein DinB